VNTELETPAVDSTEEKPKLNLKVDVTEKSACERHVTVTVPRDDIELYFSRQFDEILPKAEIPGFRAGKAPRKLVEKRFRKQLADQVKGQLLMDSLSQVSDTEDFSAISEPDLDFEQVQLPEEGDLTYEFNIEVRPEFDMPKWQGLSLTRPEHEFTDKEIEFEIQKLGQRFADLVPVDEPVQANDFIVCNITGRYENKIVSESEEQSIQIRPQLSLSDATIDGFEKLMVGAKADDKKTISAEISVFSDNEALRGKTV
jgi:trigger factor